MKINTEIVKNKEFETAIKPSLIKHSQEYRVLATLRYLYPSKFDKMVTGEAPDLQDCEKGIGIEVTAAVSENDMRASRAFSELYQGETKDIEKRKKAIESSGYTFVPLVDNKVVISTSGTADGEKHFFQESIRRKTKKLSQYRANYAEIGLAIILPEIPTSDAETNLSEWLSDILKESNNRFDFVYVISHRFCIHYDMQGNVIEKHSLTSDENRYLVTIGRMTVEGELSFSNSEEWL